MFCAEATNPSDAVTVTVVAPYRNEARNLPAFIERIPDWIDEVIFVDGSSTDGSSEVIARLMPSAKQVQQPGTGKGLALAYGMLHATSDIVVAIDTDGSMDPSTCGHYIQPLLDGADLVKGSRYLPGGGSEDLTILRSAGNRCLTASANVLFGQRWSELCYGYFALWTQHLTVLEIDQLVQFAEIEDSPARFYGSGFEIETLMFCRAARRSLGVVEVPSFEKPRAHGQSNLRTFRDGLRVVWGLYLERSREIALAPALSA
jgi:glycosyltransferase involved in cell wall biosynthesis